MADAVSSVRRNLEELNSFWIPVENPGDFTCHVLVILNRIRLFCTLFFSYFTLIKPDYEAGVVGDFNILEYDFMAVCLIAEIVGYTVHSGGWFLVRINFWVFLR